MAVQWGLAAPQGDAMSTLRAMGQGEADGIRQQQARETQRETLRKAEAREALGDLVRAGMKVSPGQPSASTGVQNLMQIGGAPDPRQQALERLSYADPEMVFSAQKEERAATKEQLGIYRDLNAQALQLLGGVHDQASYDAARQRGERMYAQYGLSTDEFELPDQYDPEVVRRLMFSALETDKQLSQDRSDRRLDWDIADDEFDNERADRDTNSRITDRDERRGLVARGQDVRAATTRRSQDMTDRRSRDRPGRAGGGRRGAGAGRITQTATGPDGRKVGWNGSAWVPVK